MIKFRILILMALAVFAAAGCAPVFVAPAAETPAAASNIINATFVCPDGTTLDTTFNNNDNTVTVALPDGTVTLPQVVSADGARYSDGTTTFWNTGDEAMVEVNGQIVYQNCTTQPSSETTAPAAASDESNIINATFVCPDGTSLDTTFNNNDNTVTVALPDGTVTLPQVVSADGARYSDGTTTFWNKGDEAMVEVNGEILYQNCVAQPAS